MRVLWGEDSTNHSVPALFSLFCVWWWLARMHHWPVPLFRPGSIHSSSVSWGECEQAFADKLCVSLFHQKIPTLSLYSPFWLCGVMGACMVRCTLPFLILAEWLGSFMFHWETTWMEQILNKSQHSKLTECGGENSPTTPASEWICIIPIMSLVHCQLS